MKNLFATIALILILSPILMTGCSSTKEAGPEDIYWEYHEACQADQYEVAQRFLTAEARKRSAVIGVCGFTHDALSDIDQANGITERSFISGPELTEQEDAAVLTWIDEMGFIVSVFMSKTEDGWMVAEILRSI